jgi:hypothetical protein
MFYVDLNEGEPDDAEDIIKKSIEEIHKSAKGELDPCSLKVYISKGKVRSLPYLFYIPICLAFSHFLY